MAERAEYVEQVQDAEAILVHRDDLPRYRRSLWLSAVTAFALVFGGMLLVALLLVVPATLLFGPAGVTAAVPVLVIGCTVMEGASESLSEVIRDRMHGRLRIIRPDAAA